jgi:cytochrome P450
MTEVNADVDLPMGQMSATSCPAAFARPAPGDPWIASRFVDVRAVLSDSRFEVPQADPCDAVGTIAWLRASVSRFVNGAEHERRRAKAVGELAQLLPEQLRSEAKERSRVVLAGLGRAGDRVELMGPLARRVPMTTLAAALQCPDPESAATAVIAAAAGYLFAPENPESLRLADAATARLVEMFMPSEMRAAIARISLLAQGCDATAGLVGTTLEVLQDATLTATVETTEALLTEILRHSPSLLVSRRVAGSDLHFDGCQVSAGDTVLCHVDTANRDPAAFDRPDQFDPSRKGPLNLTFGYGIRPCPAAPHALALAAGVIDAVREVCRFLPGGRVDYEPSGLRIPQRIEVVLR